MLNDGTLKHVFVLLYHPSYLTSLILGKRLLTEATNYLTTGAQIFSFYYVPHCPRGIGGSNPPSMVVPTISFEHTHGFSSVTCPKLTRLK